MSFRIAKIWELLDRFKDQCQLMGWKTSEHEDWIKTGDGEYHNFLWGIEPTLTSRMLIQIVHPSTFEKIAANHKCAIRKGNSFQVVDVLYTAWLFLRSPPENLTQTFKENPELSKRTAIYDLSKAFTDNPLCSKLNETNSKVFKEFETFLEEELGVKFNPPPTQVRKSP